MPASELGMEPRRGAISTLFLWCHLFCLGPGTKVRIESESYKSWISVSKLVR